MADTIQVVRVDGIPLGPLEDIQAIVMQYTDRLGYLLELTEVRVRRHTEGVGWERRLISEWEAVDAAG